MVEASNILAEEIILKYLVVNQPTLRPSTFVVASIVSNLGQAVLLIPS